MARYKSKQDWEMQGKQKINPIELKEYLPEYAEIAQNLAATDTTETDIAFLLGISKHNLQVWKREHPDFKRSLNRGKELKLAHLLSDGMKAAHGGTYVEKTIEYIAEVDDNGKIVDVVKNEKGNQRAKVKEVHKNIPPNEKLLMFLISAIDRQLGRDNWIHKQSIETKIDKTIVHKFEASDVAAQIDKLSGKLTKYVESKEVEADKKILEADFESTAVQENIEKS